MPVMERLEADVERLIDAFVDSGRFGTRDDVIAHAVRAMAEREAEEREALKAHVQRGLDGPFFDQEEVVARLEARFAQRDQALARR
jgi:putative addiction module CopG family antidote